MWGKKQALVFGKKQEQEQLTFVVDEEKVYCKDSIRYLDVMIDNKLSWNAHVDYVSNKGKQLSYKFA